MFDRISSVVTDGRPPPLETGGLRLDKVDWVAALMEHFAHDQSEGHLRLQRSQIIAKRFEICRLRGRISDGVQRFGSLRFCKMRGGTFQSALVARDLRESESLSRFCLPRPSFSRKSYLRGSIFFVKSSVIKCLRRLRLPLSSSPSRLLLSRRPERFSSSMIKIPEIGGAQCRA